MPYKIFPENGKQCVYKHDADGNKVGKSLGCHPNRKDAIGQLRALYAQEPGAKEVGMDNCPTCGAKIKSSDKTCTACGTDLTQQGHKAVVTKSEGDGNHPASHYLVVENPSSPTTWHLRVRNMSGAIDHGLCGAAWAALHEGYRGSKYAGPNKQEAIAKLTAIYNQQEWPLPGSTSVKALEKDGERYIVLWTANAFMDRENEAFRTKALEDYVARHDATGDYGRVWFWHVKGTDFATVVWEEVVGRMLVSVARLDKTAYADKMYHALSHPEEYPDLLPMGWGTSHGYVYRVGDKEDGVYSFMEKFEATVLPYHRASNPWGGVRGVIDMARTKEKDDALRQLVTSAIADEVLQGAEQATSVLEQAGIEFKEVGRKDDGAEAQANDNPDEESEDTDEESEDNEEGAGDDADDQLYELEVSEELVKEIAGAIDIQSAVKEHVGTAVTGLKEQLVAALTPVILEAVKMAVAAEVKNIQGSKEQIVQEALSGKIRLNPWSASQSSDTVVSPEHVAGAKEAKTGKKQQDIVSQVVANMLNGGL